MPSSHFISTYHSFLHSPKYFIFSCTLTEIPGVLSVLGKATVIMSARYLRFLTTAQVMRLYETNITRARPSQPTYLESAVFSPQQHKHYGQDNLFQLAGLLAEKIILNHPYQDGNKRIALLAADMFLKMNGYQLQKTLFTRDELDQQLQNAHVAVATSQWDAESLASFYQSVATPIPRVTSEIRQYMDESEQS